MVPDDDKLDQIWDKVLDWAEASVVRIIVMRIVPMIMGTAIVNVFLAWLQAELGLNLPAEVVATWLGTAIGGAGLLGFAYVRNHGRGLVELLRPAVEFVIKSHQVGSGYASPGEEPAVPPGLEPDR